VTSPRQLPPWLRAENPAAALDYEIAREKASALGRLGRRLEAALAALAAFDAESKNEAFAPAAKRSEERKELVAAAGEVLWSFIVCEPCVITACRPRCGCAWACFPVRCSRKADRPARRPLAPIREIFQLHADLTKPSGCPAVVSAHAQTRRTQCRS
jgi:hypothetical protein